MKTKRNLSGVYCHIKNEKTDQIDYICFEELSPEQQDEFMNCRSDEWLKALIKQLAATLNEIGEQFDIVNK